MQHANDPATDCPGWGAADDAQRAEWEARNEAQREELELAELRRLAGGYSDIAAWRERWPMHCRRCGGWGLFVDYGKPGKPQAETCLALPPGSCHRCGLLDLGGGACPDCGWNLNDGDPGIGM